MFDLPLGLSLHICDLTVLACLCVLFKLILIEAFLKRVQTPYGAFQISLVFK